MSRVQEECVLTSVHTQAVHLPRELPGASPGLALAPSPGPRKLYA